MVHKDSQGAVTPKYDFFSFRSAARDLFITLNQDWSLNNMLKQTNAYPTWLATTASCGSSGSAAANKACSDRRTVLSVIAAALEVKAHNQSSTFWTSWFTNMKWSVAGWRRWSRVHSYLQRDITCQNQCVSISYYVTEQCVCVCVCACLRSWSHCCWHIQVCAVAGDWWRMWGMLWYTDSPLVFENVQTYCTCDWADVGMPDFCDKPHLGRGKII